MCKKKQFKYCPSEIDKCLRNLIRHLNNMYRNHVMMVETVGCCCGHGKYPMTILVKDNFGNVWDLISLETINRKRNFYKKDKQGYYYIPETLK